MKINNSIYSLIPRCRKTNIKPGDKLEIEIFMTGYGIPEYNKLDIKSSSPYVIASGLMYYSIKEATNNKTNEKQPVSGKAYLEEVPLTQIGIVMSLVRAYFMDNPRDLPKDIDFGIPMIMSENSWDDYPPILLTIITNKKAPKGDYDIYLTFTYSIQGNLSQDQKVVQFHINNWWERNQGWIGIIGAFIAIVSLIANLVFSILNLYQG